MQLNKSFLAIVNGQTDRITDICDSRVAFANENLDTYLIQYHSGIYKLIRTSNYDIIEQ